jgi:hypothetical protein
MNVGVLFQILSKSKFLEANHAHELLCRLVGSHVSSQ